MSVGLNKVEINRIYESWNMILSDSEKIGETFYQRLFEVEPSLKVYFKHDIHSQISKFVSTLSILVSKINTSNSLMNEVQFLASRHVGYGVRTEHYKIVGEALIWSLEKNLGRSWNNGTRAAWEKMYNNLSNAMIRWSEVNGGINRVA